MRDRRLSGLRFLVVTAALLMPSVVWADPPDPVVVVPGFLGTTLVDGADGDRVVFGSLASTLRSFDNLEVPLPPAQTSLRPGQILDSFELLGPFEIGAYGSLRRFLKQLGFESGKTLFECGYDWRLSNFESGKTLRDCIDAQPELVGKKVQLVAHSMGGLVSLVYLHEYGGIDRVSKLITLGTPYLGAIDAFSTLVDGWGDFRTFLAGGQSSVERVTYSFASAFELLPTYGGCCAVGRPGAEGRAFNALDLDELAALGLLPDRITGSAERMAFIRSAMENGAELRALAKRTPRDVKWFRFAGGLIQTDTRAFVDPTDGKRRYQRLGGDGTVPEMSAANGSLQTALAAIHDHVTLFDDNHVRVALSRILEGEPILEDYSFDGLRGSAHVVRRDLEEIPIIGVEVKPLSQIVTPGSPLTVLVSALAHDIGQPVVDVDVRARLILADGTRRKVEGQEDSDGVHSFSFAAPSTAGVFRFEAWVPGVGPVTRLLAVAAEAME